MERLHRIASILLETDTPVHTLRQEVIELQAILLASQQTQDVRQQDLSSGETVTSSGLAISPTMATMCVEDFARTIQFIRGTHAAIVDFRTKHPERPARILYAGCGPLAPLVIPLMTAFSPEEARFTLLDIHEESIEAAESIVDTLGLADSVDRYETVDACSYRIPPDEPPDVILIEAMQACLQAEPQVAITRHLLKQAPNAILVPEKVRIDLVMVDLSCEFDMDALDPKRKPVQRDRVPVAPVFVVNREAVKAWEDNPGNRLPASRVRIPDDVEERYQPMLFTAIQVYGDHLLQDYDSGLTCPRTPSIEGYSGPGDVIQFTYELGTCPRLQGVMRTESR
jgi:hypothetical protein